MSPDSGRAFGEAATRHQSAGDGRASLGGTQGLLRDRSRRAEEAIPPRDIKANRFMTASRTGAPAPVRIEPENEWAWCGGRRLELTPRVFSVLAYLVDHRQRLVTKDDLLAAVWRGTAVSDAALASCIRDLRRQLRDSSRTPRYIETVHRRGFRFIGPIATPPPQEPMAADPMRAAGQEPPEAPALVGRDRELALLAARLEQARKGRRQPRRSRSRGRSRIRSVWPTRATSPRSCIATFETPPRCSDSPTRP